ncbi:hypothetical protein [Pseudomonas fluorescens]|uniref:hypothetical protein n=1 Tax=Pseudomonas fluorescens TaxID=294 RepID=UPI0017817CC9|nr:hypothetical protein [Pseudomonas fluorescens]
MTMLIKRLTLGELHSGQQMQAAIAKELKQQFWSRLESGIKPLLQKTEGEP